MRLKTTLALSALLLMQASARADLLQTQLIFDFATSQVGYTTTLAITNTNLTLSGDTAISGDCTLYFYGAGGGVTANTGSIAAATQWTGNTATLAPGFQGYVIANCNFPYARGSGFLIGPGGVVSEVPAEVFTVDARSAADGFTNLLFQFATNQNGFDTGIFISNTSVDPFGTVPAAGTCTLSFAGQNSPVGLVLVPFIPAGSSYATTLSALAPGFQGAVVARCNFPFARGTTALATFIQGKIAYSFFLAEELSRNTGTLVLLPPVR